MSEHLFCARASAFGMTTKSATFKTKYYCSHIYDVMYPCWVITLLNAVLVRAHGGCWCPNIYFLPGHRHSAWQPNPRHLKPEYYCSHIYHVLYPCWVITLLNAVVVKAHGGCWCPNIYFVSGHQHSAWQPNLRHLKLNIIVLIYTMWCIPAES